VSVSCCRVLAELRTCCLQAFSEKAYPFIEQFAGGMEMTLQVRGDVKIATAALDMKYSRGMDINKQSGMATRS
jgi:hypothetical protein